MFRKFAFPLLYPPDTSGSGGADDSGSESLAQDLADLEDLPEEEDQSEDEGDEGKKPVKGKTKDENEEDDDEIVPLGEDEDEEDDEEEEGVEKPARKKTGEGEDETDENESEEKEEPEIELDTHGRPTVKAINAKYKGVFKDFPDLKRSYFALPRYEAVFADPEQASEAAEKAREFDELEGELVTKGSPDALIKTLAENNPRALKKIVSNFAASVRTNFEEGYIEFANPVLEELIHTAHALGTKTGNKNLILSARHLAHFIWNNGGEIPDITKRQKGPEVSEAEKELQAERTKNAQDKFVGAVKDVMPRAETSLTGFLIQNLKGVSSFERRQIMKETLSEVNDKLTKDSAFQTALGRLWERAKSENYSDASKKRVLDAWLSRARQIAPPIRNRLRQEALDARSGKGSKSREQEDNTRERKRTFPGQGGRESRRSGSRVLDPTKIDWTKTSDMDILNSK